MMELLFLLLPVAALSGWWIGRRNRAAAAKVEALGSDGCAEGYLQGLNYVLNEEPDKAVEVFLDLVSVDRETVETHLALGSLFRRRGEVDKAIRIHQNLIARPNLTEGQRSQSLLELANDYMSAGLLDRAESLYKELLAIAHHEPDALKHLLEIYQQEKSWDELIETAKRMQQVSKSDMGKLVAHSYCELSRDRLEKGELKAADHLAQQALASDRSCVRASLLLGDIATRQGDYKRALTHYRQVEEQDPDFVPETLERQALCWSKLGKRAEYLDYLGSLAERQASGPVLLTMANELRAARGDEAARDFLLGHLDGHPSLQASHYLLSLGMHSVDHEDQAVVSRLLGQLQVLIDRQADYRCRQCGLKTKTLFWQCPTCKAWGTVKPRIIPEAG
jgi:lipopolysaccharide biosynthesis regulator YciM